MPGATNTSTRSALTVDASVSLAGGHRLGRDGGSPQGTGFGFVPRRAASEGRRRGDIPRSNSIPGLTGGRAILVGLLKMASTEHTPAGGGFALEHRLRPAYGPGRLC